MPRRLYLSLVVLLALCWAPQALAEQVTRPTEGGPYGYASQEAQPYISAHAVVHYVTQGADAPALTDANANGVPDYVEQVSQAAEKSLATYASLGFKLSSDYGWPNPLPDLYVHSLPSGLFGLTFAPGSAEGGTFVVVSNHLDASLKAPISLYATVAHELFHTVQFAYLPTAMPHWMAEGQASAMELVVYPEHEDAVFDGNLDVWLEQPWRPLYDEQQDCSHCYGSSLWWFALNSKDPALIRELLGRLWGYQEDGRPLGNGTQPLNEILEKRGFGSLYKAYTSFSLEVYRAGFSPGVDYGLTATKKAKFTKARAVYGLSTHYITVTSAVGARGLDLAVVNGGGPSPSVTLILGGPKGRVVKPRLSDHGHRALFSVSFQSAAERKAMLVITSGRQLGVAYKLGYQST